MFAKVATESDIPAWFIVAFPIFFVLMWITVSFVLSALGGWRELAENYRLVESLQTDRWRFCSARFGWVSYSNCITIAAGPDGLDLAMLVLFRPGHHPLRIPWRDIKARKDKVFWCSIIRLTIANAPTVVLCLPANLENWLIHASGNAFSVNK